MQRWLAKLLILCFALGLAKMHNATYSASAREHAIQMAENAAQVMSADDCEDGEGCDCLPWQCKAECQRCPYTPMIFATTKPPEPRPSLADLMTVSPMTLSWIEPSHQLLEPPRLA